MEKEQKKKGWDLEEDDAIKLAILTLQTVIGQEFKSNDIEIGVVSAKNPRFGKLSTERIEFYLNEVSKKDWEKWMISECILSLCWMLFCWIKSVKKEKFSILFFYH